MSNKNLILLLVILFFLGCSFSCNGLKENFECQKNKQLCGDILEMEGGEETEGAVETTCAKTRTIDGTKTNICDTCDFCKNKDKVTENFTLGRRRRHYKSARHVADCIECMNNCDEIHCQINAGWCAKKLPEYKEKCNVN
jgi:hypothetical protein